MRRNGFLGIGLAALILLAPGVYGAVDKPAHEEASVRVYIGTFTAKQAKGIYLARMDLQTGALAEPQLVAEAQSPSYLALHPNGRFLYCVNEVDTVDGKPGGAISAFSVDADSGKLALLNQQPSAGKGPTHLSVDPQGKAVLAANYGSGSVALLPIESDGKLSAPSSVDQHRGKGPDHQRQEQAHAHCINVDPAGRFALSCDLGLDKVFIYRLDSTGGKLDPGSPPTASTAPGAGPRHLAFHPNGRFVYVVNEMGCTVDAFAYNSQLGTLRHLQTVPTLPDDFNGEKSGAEIMAHPSGKFLYTSNRGAANNIAVFQIDDRTGKLTPAGHTSTQGKTPRGFGIDSSGKWLIAANQDSDNIVVFRIDPGSGALTPAGVDLLVPTPVCITFGSP